MRLRICFLLVVIGVMGSCSSDMETTQLPPNNNYFPLNKGNSWSYNNTITEEIGKPAQTTETLSVVEASQKNETTHYSLASNTPSASGIMTAIFNQGELSKSNGQLIYTGSIDLNLANIGTFLLPLNSLPLYDGYASEGTKLAGISHSIEKEIVVESKTLPLTLNYEIRTENKGFYASYSVGGKSYKNVLQANITIEASISVQLGPLPGVLLEKQDVLKIENFYADKTGLIYSEGLINMVFEDYSEFGIPQVAPIHKLTQQELDVFTPAVIID